jgi:ABC-type transport system substrate-binding protein
VGVALAASIAVSTVASSGSQAASSQSASKYGGTAKVAIFDTFPGFCFANNAANSALMATRTIYETLFEKTIGGDIVGLLATGAKGSADLKTWTINLREGIKFHDGTTMDATAVKANLDYALGHAAANFAKAAVPGNFALATKAYGTFQALGATGKLALGALGITDTTAGAVSTGNITRIALLISLGQFVDGGKFDLALGNGTKGTLKGAGLDKLPDLKFLQASIGIGTSAAFLANIIKVEATSPYVVTLTLDRAQNDVAGMLYASGRVFIRGVAQFSGDGTRCSTGRPIGTGPFKTADNFTLVSTDELKVVKNADYWRKDVKTRDKLPYLDGITFTNVKEGSQRAAAVRKGTYDAGMFSAASEATFIQDLRKRKSVVKEFKSPSEYYPSLWLNQGKANSPFKSKNARQAVLTCLDSKNFNKVRTKGEGTIPKSLVGPKSSMYSTKGFQKFSVATSKRFVAAWKAEDAVKNTELAFTIPADTSTVSQANAKFLVATWAKCGIKVGVVVEETALIIAKTFNSGAATAAEQNAYDAITILLFEGTDVAFNLPFVLTNAYAGSTSTANIFTGSVGSILGLNKHSDVKVDQLFQGGQALANTKAAAVQYKAGTAYLQTEAMMGSIQHFYYTMFVNNKRGLTNIGKIALPNGKTQRLVTNWGIDWTGVQKK